MSYNLSDNVNDNFQFELRGQRYSMRYPTTGELEEIQKLTNELNAVKEDEARSKEINEALENALYSFISPEGHDTYIKDALKSENVKVMRNFNHMIKTELSV